MKRVIKLAYKITKQFETMWIMSKICQHGEVFEMKKVQTPRCQVCTWHKRLQSAPDIFDRYITEKISRQHSRQTVLNIMNCFSFKSERNMFYMQHPDLPGSFHQRDIPVFKYAGKTVRRGMLPYPGIVLIHAKQRHITIKISFHFINEVVICIQDSIPMIKYSFGHYRFHFRHGFKSVDTTESHMICSNIGNNGYFAILKCKTCFQDPASCTFKHRKINGGIF